MCELHVRQIQCICIFYNVCMKHFEHMRLGVYVPATCLCLSTWRIRVGAQVIQFEFWSQSTARVMFNDV